MYLAMLLQNQILKVKNEVKWRKERYINSHERKQLILSSYKLLHPEIFQIQDKFITESFLKLVKYYSTKRKKIGSAELNKSITTPESNSIESNSNHEILHNTYQILPGRLIIFPVFTNEFCDSLVDEIKNYQKSTLPKEPPNSMNKYGVDLGVLGFESFVSKLRTEYLEPLARNFFGDVLDITSNGDEAKLLDSHKAFIVSYKMGEDEDLGYHYDNAEVTLNVSLNSDFDGGSLYFGEMRNVDSSFKFGYDHKKGFAVLHRGQQMHGSFPITSGERYNLIIWMRSSKIRNKLCPMCDEEPQLELVNEGTGHGFTQEVAELCSIY